MHHIHLYFEIYLSLSVAAQRVRKIGKIPCSMDRLKRPGEEIGDHNTMPVMVTLVVVILVLVKTLVMVALVLVKFLVTLVM